MITPTNDDFKNTNLMESMMTLTPNFYGLDNMVNGLMGMMKNEKLVNKGKDMTMITPMFKDMSSGPSAPGEVSLDPFFEPSPKIPMNYMPSAAINEISQSLNHYYTNRITLILRMSIKNPELFPLSWESSGYFLHYWNSKLCVYAYNVIVW